jgi:DNA-binding NarL/FixJ family response regulator
MDREGAPPLESLRHLADAIAASAIPLFVCDVADEHVLLVNAAASELFGDAASALIGSLASELWEATSAEGSTDAIAALSTGAIDSYRAHRQIPTADGPMEVSVWARNVELEEGSVAVTVVLPAADAGDAGGLIDAYLGPDAANLVVGTIDSEGRFREITPNSEQVIGLTREQVAGSELASIVHPEDVEGLMGALRRAAATAEEAAVEIRLRHPERGWTDVRCITLSGPPDQPVRLALALADATPEPHVPRPDLVDLERQVLRLAAELHAASLGPRRALSAEATRYPSLDALPSRQREIVDRLLRGERIPTIAEALFLSRSTVRNHLSKVFKTFGVGSQAELLALLRSELTGNPDN